MSVQLLVDKFSTRIQKEIDSIKDSMAEGNLEDFSKYRMTCGRLKGMEQAREILLDTKKKYMLDEEDEE